MDQKGTERLVRQWKKDLIRQGMEEGYIMEMEDHFRELLDQYLSREIDARVAFERACVQFGDIKQISHLERNESRSKYYFFYLIRNFFLVSIRHLGRNPLISGINFMGLVVAFTSILFITLFLYDELTYEKHHPEYDKIYRLSYSFTGENGDVEDRAYSSGMWIDLLKERIPSIKETFRFLTLSYGYVYNEQTNSSFYEEGIYWSDPNYFDFLNFPLKYGEKEAQLKDLHSLILTERTAKKIFGEENPIGKTLEYRRTDYSVQLVVTGVIYDPPSNSLFQPDYIAHIQAIQGIYGDRYRGWVDKNPRAGYVSSYLKLNNSSDVELMSSELQGIWNELLPDRASSLKPLITPLSDIHFNPPIKWEADNPIDMNYIYGLLIIGVFILIVAATNYISLTTALGSKRQKEIGLRSTFGGTYNQLQFQFTIESAISIVISLAISILCVVFLTPSFNQMIGKRINILTVFQDPLFIIPLLVMFTFMLVLMTVFTSRYFLRHLNSGLNIGHVLKKKGNQHTGRNIWVIIQFTVAIILVICTTTVYQQLSLINNGFLARQSQQVMGIRTSRMGDSLQVQRLKQEVSKLSGVASNTLGEHLPKQSDFGRIDTRYYASTTGDQQFYWDKFEVDGGFLETYDLRLLSGRDFRENIEPGHLIVNEKLVRSLNLTPEEAIGVVLREDSINYVYGHADGVIVGVVEDFAYRSLKDPIQPLVITASNYVEGVLSVKLTGNYEQTISEMAKVFADIYPGRPFEYWFLEKEFDRLYHQERRMGKLIPIFTIMAVIIALMGLFAMAAYIAEIRQKEIGIRKVLGCSTQGILSLLIRQNLLTLLIAMVVAIPIAYLTIDYWLSSFNYRVAISVWTFGLGIMLISIFSIAIIAIQSLKTALQNPAKSIQYE